MSKVEVPKVLSIAGSDSGGGAGIQADLKAFALCGVHGMTAITAITAQNTESVTDVMLVPAEMIVAQVKAVAEDIGVDAVKVGMLANREVIDAVDRALELVPEATLVVDPVMVAESGAELLEPDAVSALIERLLPRATVVTPNIHEARSLTGLDERASVEELARAVHGLGPRAVVITGGHGEGSADDTFFDGERVERIQGELHPGGASHGSGCTHSSALAAQLALGREPLEAAIEAKAIASEAVRHGLEGLGGGVGPVDVFGIAEAESGNDDKC